MMLLIVFKSYDIFNFVNSQSEILYLAFHQHAYMFREFSKQKSRFSSWNICSCLAFVPQERFIIGGLYRIYFST